MLSLNGELRSILTQMNAYLTKVALQLGVNLGLLLAIICVFKVYKVAKGKYMVQSIPAELSLDEAAILTAASNTEQGFITITLLVTQLRWTEYRAKQAIEKIISDGLCWIDEQDNETSYWFPSLFPGRTTST